MQVGAHWANTTAPDAGIPGNLAVRSGTIRCRRVGPETPNLEQSRTVGVDGVGATTGTAASNSHRRDRLNQRHQLGDVVAVAAGQRHRQRDAVRLGDQVVFRAGSGTVDRARPGFGPPFKARTREPSTTTLDQSSAPAACSSANRDSCRHCQTPASFQSRRHRQQVMPDPNPNSVEGTPMKSRCIERTRSHRAPCGRAVAGGRDDRLGVARRPAAAVGHVSAARRRRAMVAARPSSRRDQHTR